VAVPSDLTATAELLIRSALESAGTVFKEDKNAPHVADPDICENAKLMERLLGVACAREIAEISAAAAISS
jgi:hypothetical protein